MIEDETEPTIIREAAEFSLFNRENLQTESLDNTSLLSTKNEDANKEGVTNTPNINNDSNVMTTSKTGVVNSSSITGNTSSIVGGGMVSHLVCCTLCMYVYVPSLSTPLPHPHTYIHTYRVYQHTLYPVLQLIH